MAKSKKSKLAINEIIEWAQHYWPRAEGRLFIAGKLKRKMGASKAELVKELRRATGNFYYESDVTPGFLTTLDSWGYPYVQVEYGSVYLDAGRRVAHFESVGTENANFSDDVIESSIGFLDENGDSRTYAVIQGFVNSEV